MKVIKQTRTAAVSAYPWVALDPRGSGSTLSYQMTLSGTGNLQYAIQFTLDDPELTTPTIFAAIATAAVDAGAGYTNPVAGIRVQVFSVSGAVDYTLRVLQ